MTTRFRLSPDGIKAEKFDDDACDKVDFQKQKDGTVHVVDSETKEVLHVTPTWDDASNLYWKPTEALSLTLLQDGFEIEEGFRLSHLVDLLNEDEMLYHLCELLFPHFIGRINFIQSFREVIVNREGWMEGGQIQFFNVADCEGEGRDPLIRLGNHMEIESLNRLICEGECNIRLIQFLDALFHGHIERDPVVLTKEGLGDDPMRLLLNPCTFADDLTYFDLFNVAIQNEEFADFFSMYSSCYHMEDFLREAQLPTTSHEGPEIFHVLLYMWAELHLGQGKRGYPKDTIEHFCDFNGIGEPDPEFGDGHPTQNYGIDYSPINWYAHLPFKLKDSLEVRQSPTYSRKGNLKTELRILAKARPVYTVLDIFDCVFYEISFHGSPKDRDAFVKEMTDRVEEIKKGEVETQPMDFPEEE